LVVSPTSKKRKTARAILFD